MALLVPEISSVFSNRNPNQKRFRFVTNNEKFGSKSRSTVRVCSGIKDSLVRTSELDRNVRSYGQFSAPVKQDSKPSKEDEEKQEYYVNMGYAIRTLREEFPELFFRELSFDIYRSDSLSFSLFGLINFGLCLVAEKCRNGKGIVEGYVLMVLVLWN